MRAGKWTGAAQGFAKKERRGRRLLCRRAPRTRRSRARRYLLFVKKTAGRAAGEVLPGVIAATLRGLELPQAHELGRLAGRRQGGVRLRPADPLAGRDARRDRRSLRDLRAGRRGEGQGAGGERSGDGGPSLPAERRGRRRPRSSATSGSSQERCGAISCSSLPRSARAKIDDELARATGGGPPPDDHGLREEWRDLVEYPTVLVGEVPAEFRSLPREVLETVLVHHQKYIPLAGRRRGTWRASRRVTNTDGAAGAEIARGMERVVVARLRDASFFYAEDRKRPLADRVGDLAGVTFHQGLGSYKDKVERMVRLVETMGELGLLSEEEGDARRGGGPAGQGRSHDPHGPRVPGAAGEDGGLVPAAPGRGAGGGEGRATGTTTRFCSGEDAAACGGVSGRRERESSRRFRSPTSSTRSPAISASGSCLPEAATPSVFGAPARGRPRASWTSGRPRRGRARPTCARWPRRRRPGTRARSGRPPRS